MMSSGTDAKVVVGVQLETASETLPNAAEQPPWKFRPVMVTLIALVLTCVLGRIAKTMGDGGVGVSVGADVGVSVGAVVGVSVGTLVGVLVGTNVLVAVGGTVGVLVATGVAVASRVPVAVGGAGGVLVAVGKLMDVGVGLAVGIGVGTVAGVAIGVAVGVAVGVTVGVAVGVGGSITMDNGVLLADTGVRAKRAISVAASPIRLGSSTANKVPSPDSLA
jgi:hypothetical protein